MARNSLRKKRAVEAILSTNDLQSVYATMNITVQFVSGRIQPEWEDEPLLPLSLSLQIYFCFSFVTLVPPQCLDPCEFARKYVGMADDDRTGLDDHRSKERRRLSCL